MFLIDPYRLYTIYLEENTLSLYKGVGIDPTS